MSGAIIKVDEWADNVEGVLLGNPDSNAPAGNVATPPRPSEGGFYTAAGTAVSLLCFVYTILVGTWSARPAILGLEL